MDPSASWAALGGSLPAPGKLYPVLGFLAQDSYRATEERPLIAMMVKGLKPLLCEGKLERAGTVQPKKEKTHGGPQEHV